MRMFLNATQKEAFRSVANYFAVRRVKTLTCSEPSYVRAEIGSWFSFADEGNAKGEVEVKVTRTNGGCDVQFDFDFTKEYSLGLAAAVLGAFSCLIIGLWSMQGLRILWLLSSAELWTTAGHLVVGLLVVALFASIMTLERHAVSRTKERFAGEFAMLMQHLASRRLDAS